MPSEGEVQIISQSSTSSRQLNNDRKQNWGFWHKCKERRGESAWCSIISSLETILQKFQYLKNLARDKQGMRVAGDFWAEVFCLRKHFVGK